MSDSIDPVGVDLLVIPDGVSGGLLRIGIQATPSLHAAGSLDLTDWPAEIARLGQSVRVRFADRDGRPVAPVDGVETVSLMDGFFREPHRDALDQPRGEAASELWRRIFEPVGFAALRATLADVETRLAEEGPPETGAARSADLQMLFDLREVHGMPTAEVWRQIAHWIDDRPDVESFLTAGAGSQKDNKDEVSRLRAGLELLLSPDGAKALGTHAEAEAEVIRLFRQHAAMTLAPPPTGDGPEEDILEEMEKWGRDDQQAAGRKLASLLSLPTLSHYFGLGLLVEIEIADLPPAIRKGGAIAVEFVGVSGQPAPSGTLAWTAFELDEGSNYFAPANETAGLYEGGLLNLAVETSPGERRFFLRAEDAVNTFWQGVASGRARLDGVDLAPPEVMLRRGLALHDRKAQGAVQAEEAWAARDLQTLGVGTKINFAEHLIKGYRPDFGVSRALGEVASLPGDRWRSVTNRSVVCKHPLLDESFYEHDAIRSIKARDHGFAQSLVEERTAAKSGRTFLVKQDECLVWAGESLAVSPTGENGVAVSPHWDLGLDLEIDLPEPGDDEQAHSEAMPPLREGLGYLCGCRVVYANGSGPTLEEARRRYASDTRFVVGDDRKPTAADHVRPLAYPAEPSPAPDVHYGWDDPVIEEENPAAAAPGESVFQMAVHDGAGGRKRILTPPRISFDAAELQGQLDLESGSPAGVLKDEAGVWLFGVHGVFPEARFGKTLGPLRWRYDPEPGCDPTNPPPPVLKHVAIPPRKPLTDIVLSPHDREYSAIEFGQSRGTVAVIGKQTEAVRQGAFHVDRKGGTLTACLRRIGFEGGGPIDPVSRAFWTGGNFATARPVFIELRPGAKAGFATTDSIAAETVDGVTKTFGLIRATLPRGERYELELKAAGADAKPSIISLVHAVRRPLSEPRLVGADSNGRPLGINAISVTVAQSPSRATEEASGTMRTSAGASAGLATWADKVAAFKGDMLDWPSEEGGSQTYFSGRVEVDRKSTGSLRFNAVWEEYDEHTVSRDAGDRWVRNLAEQTAQLFQFELDQTGSEDDAVDLVWRSAPEAPLDEPPDEPRELRALSHAFADGRARRLAVKVTAISAFRNFYSSALAAGEFETQAEGEVWTECTFRPPPPRISRILPLFDWSDIDGRKETSRRTTRLRLFLDSGWYASGQGEKLGLVLLDGDRPEEVCDYETGSLAPFHRFITRCGADPIHRPQITPIRLDMRHFPADQESITGRVWLSDPEWQSPAAARDKALARGSLAVRVIPLTPQFDPREGLYCDLPLIDLGQAYMPFLQLGLVRVQEHAIAHLQLSHPVEFQAQLPPERRVEVIRPGAGNRTLRTLVVSGPGYVLPTLDPAQTHHGLPELDVKLLEWRSDLEEWRVRRELVSGLRPDHMGGGNEGFIWTLPFKLETLHSDPEMFRLLVEEYECLPADIATDTDVGGRALFVEGAARRLVFSCLQNARANAPPL